MTTIEIRERRTMLKQLVEAYNIATTSKTVSATSGLIAWLMAHAAAVGVIVTWIGYLAAFCTCIIAIGGAIKVLVGWYFSAKAFLHRRKLKHSKVKPSHK